ncbi:hypothetical protein POL68_13465 [Stigmatella sp. ncwal1]|uniref:Uncharacterized protein n=1 Tax=Stigmatella ashevillensis TaxID=2995309 RepID=A0ABT5D742_9BACT|nr:hypothetical protein [Stigmatella ashevillena]MDC0709474.1 hypothetical protein [Stigmatella ashevillena]
MAKRKNALTVVVPIRSGTRHLLEAELKKIGQEVRGPPGCQLKGLRATHFLRWVTLPGPQGGERQESRWLLAFEANFDGTAGEFLDELVGAIGDTLKACVYAYGEPSLSVRDSDETLKSYLLDHAVKEKLFFQGYPDLTVEEISDAARTYGHIRQFLARRWPTAARSMELSKRYASLPPTRQGQEAVQLHRDIRQHLENLEQTQTRQVASTLGTAEKQRVPRRGSKWERGLKRLQRTRPVRYGLGALALPVAIPTGAVLVGLDLWEGRQAAKKGSPEAMMAAYQEKELEAQRQLRKLEDHGGQNQLTHLVELKSGLLRPHLLRLSLGIWRYWANHYFAEGELGGIQGIHFARWVFLPDEEDNGARGTRKKYRLLFFSNYDGSWEDYLGNFVDRASIGLTSIWCNTEGFPRTHWVPWIQWKKLRIPRLELGAAREDAFKHWVRQAQVYTEAWFSRNPDMSVSNILNDREICSKVKTRLSARSAKDWLQRL